MTGDLWKRGKRSASRVPRRRSRRSRPSRAPISIISASGSGRACPSVVSSAQRRRELRRPTPFCSRFPGCAPSPLRLWFSKHWPAFLGFFDGLDPRVVNTAPTIADDMVNGLKLYRANIRPSLGKPRDRYTDVPVQLILNKYDKAVRPVGYEDTEKMASPTCSDVKLPRDTGRRFHIRARLPNMRGHLSRA